MLRTQLSFFVGVSALLAASAAQAVPVTPADEILNDVVASGITYRAGQGNFNPYPYTYVRPTFAGYADQVTYAGAPSWTAGDQPYKWGDVIGEPNQFQLETVSIWKTDDKLYIRQYTQFDGKSSLVTPANLGALTSHIFIDTLTPTRADSFNYAVVLGTDDDDPSAGLAMRAIPGLVAVSGLYEVTAANLKTPSDLWTGGGWGGLIQFCRDANGPGGACNANDPDHYGTGLPIDSTDGFAIAPPVLAVNIPATQNTPAALMTKVGDVAWSRTDATNGWWYLDAVISNVNMSLFDQFDILATAADCANDALWGPVDLPDHVPAPGALLLLGFGLAGLGAVRRRKAA